METPNVVNMQAFVPAQDFEESTRYYRALGFEVHWDGGSVREVGLGGFSFLLQDYFVEEWASNFMMSLEVEDLDEWWDHIRKSKVEEQFAGIRSNPPHDDGGTRIAHLTDPAGVCWNIMERKR